MRIAGLAIGAFWRVVGFGKPDDFLKPVPAAIALILITWHIW
jgi:hypothetical protein